VKQALPFFDKGTPRRNLNYNKFEFARFGFESVGVFLLRHALAWRFIVKRKEKRL
jgi:hypothetical protein